ncbi:beta-galactosidase [Parapedobacter indicus]|uniref:Beta-galactosidase n=2 Tax=Parapedobacter indicus TaxID=1477437 RepID=A0A1I3D2R7_9SPHI|nr:beta-galactosidase [Parapedobacter indicus]SFH81064.1 beta-galactosidase [Parapedobacter indicus]
MGSKRMLLLGLVMLLAGPASLSAQDTTARVVKTLRTDWLFMKGEVPDGARLDYDDSHWDRVDVPHDWAIVGPFDEDHDKQEVTVIEDGERVPSIRTGRTGGLPYMGVGWYRKQLSFSGTASDKRVFIEFDGAMSNAKVYLNGQWVGGRPYGYSSFGFELTPYIRWGSTNVLAVRLENEPESARWYPGAGLYRAVRLLVLNRTHIPQWGVWVTTPEITHQEALVNIRTEIATKPPVHAAIRLETDIIDPSGKVVASLKKNLLPVTGDTVSQQLRLKDPRFWSADSPRLYKAVSRIKAGDQTLDVMETVFGIRTIRFTADSGMLVNGRWEKLKGVCLHHDLGALGAAFNKSALRHRLTLLKQMGCNAIRGAHNPHDPAMLELCDEMGFYFIDEAFDEWKLPKTANGYSRWFDEWAERDLTDMIRRDRNHPALIMYSIGNEVREQQQPEGYRVARFLTAICHREDPYRPVTAGFNQWKPAIDNGLADEVDIPGFNYKPAFYGRIRQLQPTWPIYGSETASTVSSRGSYHFPAQRFSMKAWEDNQSSAYDLEHCSWSQLPDEEWKALEDHPFVAGEFVWTGVDYLGEPTPYNCRWPSRSSYFGILDLAGIPKDRYFLYKSRWSDRPTLHVLPHWTWPEKLGEHVPVYVYTNYPEAELFVNGKSQGRKRFDPGELLDRYRLRWEDVVYQPGELKVIAYDVQGEIADSAVTETAGAPFRLVLTADRDTLTTDGDDLIYVTVEVQDRQGNLCPRADHLVNFSVEGSGFLRAVDNGNPASTEAFQAQYRNAFNGKCVAIVQSNGKTGKVFIRAESQGLVVGELTVDCTAKEHYKREWVEK